MELNAYQNMELAQIKERERQDRNIQRLANLREQPAPAVATPAQLQWQDVSKLRPIEAALFAEMLAELIAPIREHVTACPFCTAKGQPHTVNLLRFGYPDGHRTWTFACSHQPLHIFRYHERTGTSHWQGKHAGLSGVERQAARVADWERSKAESIQYFKRLKEQQK